MRNAIALSAVFFCATALAHPGHDEVPATQPSAAAAGDTTSKVTIEVRGDYRYVNSNGLPDHQPGKFPNRGNPNAIAEQHYEFRMPAKPKPAEAGAAQPRAEGPQLFGVALNGVPFDPGTAEFWRDDRRLGWRMEAIGGPRNLGLDQNNAHVQPNGAYHYHAVPVGLVEKKAGDAKAEKMVQVGWAADGYPIYNAYAHSKADDAKSELKKMRSSWQLKKADRPAGEEGPGGKPDGAYTRDFEFVAGSGDLDECNGRTGVTPEFPEGTYYYVITESFPYIPRQFHGTPDASFTKRGGPGGPGGPGRPGGQGLGPGGRRPPPPGQ